MDYLTDDDLQRHFDVSPAESTLLNHLSFMNMIKSIF